MLADITTSAGLTASARRESRDRTYSVEVAVVGHGIVGSVLAGCLAAAGIRVLLLDGGCPMSALPGAHVRNLSACRADPAYRHDLVGAHLRPLPRAVNSSTDDTGAASARLTHGALPAARSTSLHGGMGALWNCIAPRLHPEVEQWPEIPAAEWPLLYARAERMLGVGTDLSAGSRRQAHLLRVLADLPGAPARAAPVAAVPESAGAGIRWTGPAEVLAGLDPGERSMVRVHSQLAAGRLHHHAGRVTAATAYAVDTGERVVVEADAFVVAAGALRTPALLWASGVLTDDGGASPLGRYLCDHPLSFARVRLDPGAVGGHPIAGDAEPAVMIPVAGDRPFHALLLCDTYDTGAFAGRDDHPLVVSLYWYTRTEPRAGNRLRFTPAATGAVRVPIPAFDYALDADERARRRVALDDLRKVGEMLGTFLPASPPQQLSAGSSMHLMGTTRMGPAADGRSVVDSWGRVWGFDNLFVAGTGVIPMATATNPTLAACALAVRTARAIARG